MSIHLGGLRAGALTALAAMSMALVASGAQARPEAAWSGDFGAIQIATTDPEDLFREWAKPTPGVNLTTMSQVRRNQPITTFIIFKGCRANPVGNCNVTVDFEVITPSGTLYAEHKGAEVWVDRPAPPPGVIQLSVAGMGLGIEDKDALGDYKVRATTTDHVAGLSVQTEQVITAVAK